MNENKINNIGNFFNFFLNICLIALTVVVVLVWCFFFDTVKETVRYDISKVQTFVLSLEGKARALSNNFNMVELCGASEDDRVLYSIQTGDTSLLSERELQMYAVVKSFVDKQAGKSQLEIAKAVNDYICENTVYASHLVEHVQSYDDSQTAYGSLVLGNTVCAGYAKAANLLLNSCGIEAIYVTGYVTGENGGAHAWSMVNLSNTWFHLDTTWNDSSEGWSYRYFLKSDEFMSQSRTWEGWRYHECPSSVEFIYN